jgi:hypothetical protein
MKNRSFASFLVLSVLGSSFVGTLCSCVENDSTDAAVRTILDVHKRSDGELDVSKLKKLREDPSLFLNRMSGTIEVYTVPAPNNTIDDFAYAIMVDTKQNRFWIHKTGGFAGVDEIYGTGIVQPDGTIRYVEPVDAGDG